MDIHSKNESEYIFYSPQCREYGLKDFRTDLRNPTIHQIITHCPWCGFELPPALGDEWYDRLEAMGLDPNNDALPPEYEDDTWWKNERL
jgi:hypothetical protein